VKPLAAFDPLRLLRELNEAGVRYVVVGAFAGRLLGSPTLTRDLDICHATDAANLEALVTVLRRLSARLRGADRPVPFRIDARSLGALRSLTLTTDAGDLDLLAIPAGTDGFDDLARTATPTDLDGLTVLVASIDDLIRMKRAAGRPKDLIELEVLGALRDELDKSKA
jgi:aminoglycoside-2''-adenylyltransferase